MSMGRTFVRAGIICFTAALLNLAIGSRAMAAQQGGSKGQSAEAADENQGEKQQAERERQAQAKEAEQERMERMQELYDEGREALDQDEFREAERSFTELVKLNGPQTDAALYWTAYAQNREGKKEAAIGTIGELKKRYPQSRWKKDGEALEIEVRSTTGSKANPEAQNDEGFETAGAAGIDEQCNPEKAIPLVEGILNGAGSPRVKSKALFVLAQNGSPQAAEEVLKGKIARGHAEQSRICREERCRTWPCLAAREPGKYWPGGVHGEQRSGGEAGGDPESISFQVTVNSLRPWQRTSRIRS